MATFKTNFIKICIFWSLFLLKRANSFIKKLIKVFNMYVPQMKTTNYDELFSKFNF